MLDSGADKGAEGGGEVGMTVSEAILTLNANVIVACERAGFHSATVKMVEGALDIVEDAALKVQEPVEPIMVNGEPECGACRYELRADADSYCPCCGRKVKWE